MQAMDTFTPSTIYTINGCDRQDVYWIKCTVGISQLLTVDNDYNRPLVFYTHYTSGLLHSMTIYIKGVNTFDNIPTVYFVVRCDDIHSAKHIIEKHIVI